MKITEAKEIFGIQKVLQFAKNAKAKVAAIRAEAHHGLETRTFDLWHSKLDEALMALPESAICPHELFRSLLQNPGSARKRIILVAKGGTPVALIGLRERSGYWEPVTQWLVPGMICPVKEGYIWRVLGAVELPIHVAWWRQVTPPPSLPWIKDVKVEPTYGISCSQDFEDYWRQTSHYKNVRKARNRCQGFEFRINDPNILEWTIMNWGGKWGTGGADGMPDLSDRLLVARYLDSRNLFYTLSLHDQGTPIAGATILIHDNDAVAYVNHRNPEYDHYGVMNRLIDCVFYWVKERGYSKIDIGGSADYKERWAPEAAQKFQFTVYPH